MNITGCRTPVQEILACFDHIAEARADKTTLVFEGEELLTARRLDRGSHGDGTDGEGEGIGAAKGPGAGARGGETDGIADAVDGDISGPSTTAEGSGGRGRDGEGFSAGAGAEGGGAGVGGDEVIAATAGVDRDREGHARGLRADVRELEVARIVVPHRDRSAGAGEGGGAGGDEDGEIAIVGGVVEGGDREAHGGEARVDRDAGGHGQLARIAGGEVHHERRGHRAGYADAAAAGAAFRDEVGQVEREGACLVVIHEHGGAAAGGTGSAGGDGDRLLAVEAGVVGGGDADPATAGAG